MKFEQLVALFHDTHRELQTWATRSVDIALVIRNWLFGGYIVEFDQGGADRAELYGKTPDQLLVRRAERTWPQRVYPTSLKQCRSFYTAYGEIRQTLSVESQSSALDTPENVADPVCGIDRQIHAWLVALCDLDDHLQCR